MESFSHPLRSRRMIRRVRQIHSHLPPVAKSRRICLNGRVADVFSKKKRSQVMAAIRSKGNKATELKLISVRRAHGIKGWRRHQPLPGKPDCVFWRERVALFVDGCFWHGCPRHGRSPNSNQNYWREKLARNRARVLRVCRKLRKNRWRVLRFWEHALTAERSVLLRLRAALATTKK